MLDIILGLYHYSGQLGKEISNNGRNEANLHVDYLLVVGRRFSVIRRIMLAGASASDRLTHTIQVKG
jgi:hypothetical protein